MDLALDRFPGKEAGSAGQWLGGAGSAGEPRKRVKPTWTGGGPRREQEGRERTSPGRPPAISTGGSRPG